MEEQLITFETAKLAKEKGFKNIKCLYTYEDSKLVEGQKYYGSLNHYDNECSAPTQSLLQKWLREVHSIYVLINYDRVLFDVEIIFEDILIYFNSTFGNSTNYKFTTYEEALETGLQEGLKLIKTQ